MRDELNVHRPFIPDASGMGTVVHTEFLRCGDKGAVSTCISTFGVLQQC